MGKSIENSRSGHETDKLIIEVAYSLFMELGYRAVSTRKIAKECGITQPALYHHFKNKQEIYLEVLHTSIKQTEEKLYSIIKNNATLQDRLYRTACYFMTNYQEDLMQMFYDIQHEMPEYIQSDMKQRWQKGFLLPIVQMMEEAISKKEIAPFEKHQTNSFEIALLFLNMIKSSNQKDYLKNMSIKEQKMEIEKKSNLIATIILFGITN
ncbi:MAG: TetR/AcrR family transcriptional regulator [Bacillus sp. (in: firmicutes)]